MKKSLVLFVFAGMLGVGASAQELDVARCSQRCLDLPLDGEPFMAGSEQRMARIRAQKKTETDPAKLKILAQQEADELEHRQDEHEKVCRKICEDK